MPFWNLQVPKPPLQRFPQGFPSEVGVPNNFRKWRELYVMSVLLRHMTATVAIVFTVLLAVNKTGIAPNAGKFAAAILMIVGMAFVTIMMELGGYSIAVRIGEFEECARANAQRMQPRYAQHKPAVYNPIFGNI